MQDGHRVSSQTIWHVLDRTWRRRDVGLILAASGSSERRFPGPAAAIDLPIASAGSLFGMALAAQLAPNYGNVLVIGAEIMSRVVANYDRDTAILSGDGARACLASAESGFAQIRDPCCPATAASPMPCISISPRPYRWTAAPSSCRPPVRFRARFRDCSAGIRSPRRMWRHS